MPLRTLHRTSAILITLFACLHLTNHLVSLAGIPMHISFMEAARSVYRQPVVETLLLACVAFQVASGSWFLVTGWKQRTGALPWIQAISGAMLAFFLLVHVSAIMFGRVQLQLDTNFYYAAAGFHVPPFHYFFAPYYFFAVLALFTHLGCAAYWQLEEAPLIKRKAAMVVAMTAGGAIALLIVLSLAGQLAPVEIPAIYKATYTGR